MKVIRFFYIVLYSITIVHAQGYYLDHVPQKLPIAALSQQGALDFSKIHTTHAKSYQSSPYGIHDQPTSSLQYTSNISNCGVSGSIDPLSAVYLIRDSPKIITAVTQGICYLFKGTKKSKQNKEAQQIEEYLYMIDGDRAQIYIELSLEQAIARDLIYLENHIEELHIATYTCTVPKGHYSAYCNLEEKLRSAYRVLLQQHPRTQEDQLQAELRIAQYTLSIVKKTVFKDKKLRRRTISAYGSAVGAAKEKLKQFKQEEALCLVAAQHAWQAQKIFKAQQDELGNYCCAQHEYALYCDNLVWYDRVSTRVETLNQCIQPHLITKTYTLSDDALANLQYYQLDMASIQNLSGNAYQHCLHQELIDFIEATTLTLSYNESYKEALLNCSISACAYNHSGESLNATKITDLCWILLDYGSTAVEGIRLGLCSALFHTLTHPIETTLYAVAGPYMAAYQLTSVLYSVLDIGITHAYDADAAHEKWDEFVQPVTDIYDALTDKKLTTRDQIKTGTMLATSIYVQIKLIGGLQKLCKAVLNEIAALIGTKPQTAPQDLMTTSEGTVFRQFNDTTNQSNLVATNTDISEVINQTEIAILKNGYYEVNGFKFTEFYYNKLWNSGRSAPSLVAQAILDNPIKIIPDPANYSGFFKYFTDEWEMIYNPTTKIVSHIQPIRNKRV